MTQKKWWLIAAVTAALMATGLWILSPKPSNPKTPGSHDGIASWFISQGKPTQAEPASGAATPDHQRPDSAKPGSPLDTMILPTFRATSKGHLTLDQQTRQDVERIYALFPRDEAQAKLESQSNALPAPAQRELKDLFQQYAQYAQAVTQTFAPDQGAGSLDDAVRQLNGLKDLRRQYFGEDMAQALFGEEEKTTQELLELMRKQADPKLTLEEKAEQAQDDWKKRQPPSSQP